MRPWPSFDGRAPPCPSTSFDLRELPVRVFYTLALYLFLSLSRSRSRSLALALSLPPSAFCWLMALTLRGHYRLTGAVVQRWRCTQDGGEYWEVCRECSPLLSHLSQVFQLSSMLSFSCSSQTGLVIIVRIIMIIIQSTPFPARLSLA